MTKPSEHPGKKKAGFVIQKWCVFGEFIELFHYRIKMIAKVVSRKIKHVALYITVWTSYVPRDEYLTPTKVVSYLDWDFKSPIYECKRAEEKAICGFV